MADSISGFAEYLPQVQVLADKIENTFRKECELVGAIHISTPAVERVKTLQDKGSDNKEIYRLTRLAEPVEGLTDLALRFDHTVPLARYVADHQREICFPFMRYSIGPVWRGERAQKGRYRQFTQADIDVIGDGALSLLNDAQMLAVIYRVFQQLTIGEFIISLNNRKALTCFLSGVGFADNQITNALKIIDNLDKVSEDKTAEALYELVGDADAVNKTLDYFKFSGSVNETLAYLSRLDYGDDFSSGVSELGEVISYMKSLDIPESCFRIDLGVARGLDYYTGTVYETRLVDHPQIGSVCSGGRYAHLLEKLGAKKHLPGVGVSIGVTRLLASLLENGIFVPENTQNNSVLLTTMDSNFIKKYLSIAAELRSKGVSVYVYSESHKLAKQLKFAEKRSIRFVVIAGGNEFTKDTVLIRDLKTGEQIEVEQFTLANRMISLLNQSD